MKSDSLLPGVYVVMGDCSHMLRVEEQLCCVSRLPEVVKTERHDYLCSVTGKERHMEPIWTETSLRSDLNTAG